MGQFELHGGHLSSDSQRQALLIRLLSSVPASLSESLRGLALKAVLAQPPVSALWVFLGSGARVGLSVSLPASAFRPSSASSST